jgi:hypothetical protein
MEVRHVGLCRVAQELSGTHHHCGRNQIKHSCSGGNVHGSAWKDFEGSTEKGKWVDVVISDPRS